MHSLPVLCANNEYKLVLEENLHSKTHPEVIHRRINGDAKKQLETISLIISQKWILLLQ
jgi:hypothetical protein